MIPRILLPIAVAALAACSRMEPSPGGAVPSAALAPQNPRTPSAAPARHLLITAELTEGGLRILATQPVEQPMPIDRAPELSPMRVRLEDAVGDALWVGAVDGTVGLRGEHHGEDGQIEAHHPDVASSLVTIRTPVLEEARTLRLFARGGTRASMQAQSKPANPDAMVDLGSAPLPLEPR